VRVERTGGIVQVMLNHVEPKHPALRLDSPDNRIINVAANLDAEGKQVVLVSKDINCRVKATALGLVAQDFQNQKVDFEHLYRGYRDLTVARQFIDQLFRGDDGVALPDGSTDTPLSANEFVLLHNAEDENHTALARFDGDAQLLRPVRNKRTNIFGIAPRNLQQTMAFDLLLDDRVKLVTLLGNAGTGKTLLALAAGMDKTLKESVYEKLLVARPIMPMGRDIGYLPGDKDEKLAAWMQPIFDNLTLLLGNRLSEDGKGEPKATSITVEKKIAALMAEGTVVLEPLTYIRGRSIPQQYLIVDEAQNLTPHEVKTIATRVGEGTKLILTGDASQIDNPYLDSSSNGLSYVVERLKNNALVGHVTLAKAERSELASLVAETL
ncbi:MAG: PhoH family protein, partial [Planctomycetota bacterium]